MLRRLIPIGIIGAAFTLFMTLLFGIAGMRLSLAFIILCWAPFYMLLEKWIRTMDAYWLSFFLSLPLYASLVYGLGFFISFKLSTILAAAVILGLSFIPFEKLHKFTEKEIKDTETK